MKVILEVSRHDLETKKGDYAFETEEEVLQQLKENFYDSPWDYPLEWKIVE